MRRVNPKPVALMTLAELRAEQARRSDGVAKPCKCAPCLNRADLVDEELRHRAAQPVEQAAEDLSEFDPFFLSLGQRIPKVKKQRVWSQEQRVAAAKRMRKAIEFSRTTEGIAREQNRMARAWGWAKVVRG